MSSILDSTEVRESLAPMSVEFYQAAADLGWWDEDVELLDGFPVNECKHAASESVPGFSVEVGELL